MEVEKDEVRRSPVCVPGQPHKNVSAFAKPVPRPSLVPHNYCLCVAPFTSCGPIIVSTASRLKLSRDRGFVLGLWSSARYSPFDRRLDAIGCRLRLGFGWRGHVDNHRLGAAPHCEGTNKKHQYQHTARDGNPKNDGRGFIVVVHVEYPLPPSPTAPHSRLTPTRRVRGWWVGD